MCLSKVSKKLVADRDITCYKWVKITQTIEDFHNTVKDGYSFVGNFRGTLCEGKINKVNDRVFFCTNLSAADGNTAPNRHGYRNSWEMDDNMAISSINGVATKIRMITPYREYEVEIGQTYTSSLLKSDEWVTVGLHSFVSLEDAKKDTDGSATYCVECIIPKDSVFYKGLFNDTPAYASDKITYVKIISDEK